MKTHQVRVYPSKETLPREKHLAWKLSQIAAEHTPLDADVEEMIGNRIIDNAAVALGAINRAPVRHARAQALAHPATRGEGATLFGMPNEFGVSPEWAAWANGTAVRELDMHDTFLAADYSHPADNIPPILAVAQQLGCNGKELLRGIAAGYEIHIDLVTGMCLHEYKKDHIAHLCPAQAGGIGALLNLDAEEIYQAIQQAVHVSFTTRQSRKGEISSWKAYAPAHAGKLAIEAVDRAMRGEKSPSPIYEGEDGVIAWMLGGNKAKYEIPLPEAGEPKRAIMQSYTKEHSAEYQSQALIDLAFKFREEITDLEAIENITIHTSHHTHYVIGTGSGDPQKMDPTASRETLDHSIMYIFTVALQDGYWHHINSYLPERASREDTVRLWQKVETKEDPEWTRRYHTADPNEKAFGGRVEMTFKDGSSLSHELAVANAHPFGASPFARPDYQQKFELLTEGLVSIDERNRFFTAVNGLAQLDKGELSQLNVQIDPERLENRVRDQEGIF